MGLVAVGSKIPLTVIVEGDPSLVATKYVRATLRNAAGAALPESPKNVPYVANNMFQDLSIDMPDTAFVNAQYDLYEDDDFLSPSPDHQQGSAGERFDKDVGTTEIGNLITLAQASGNELLGRFEDNDLSGKLESSELAAKIEGSDLIGVLEADPELVGLLKDDDLEGEIL